MMIQNYHKTRKNLYFDYIKAVFDRARSLAVSLAQDKHPFSIIRTTNGMAGSVPAINDSSIIYIAGI